jgi:sialate O-acetylesterase
MVAPAIEYPIRGVIWYQGETNSKLDRAALYERLFPALIADWRKHWQVGSFPFLYAQISSFKSNATENWSIVREAQRRTLSVANTAMAVTIDIGDPDNVHPSNKQDVGTRLALGARALAYGENIEFSGPLFRLASRSDEAVRLWFDHIGSGLVSKVDPLPGFEIASEDHHFVPATARIDGQSVVVASSQVHRPKYVRYAWQNAPATGLFNKEGLPASPFTTEQDIPAP